MVTSSPVLRTSLAAALAAVAFARAGAASANPASSVPTAADPGNPVDFNLWLDYDYSLERSTVVREAAGSTTDPLAPMPRAPELEFAQFRHTLTPRAELGVYHDTWLSFAMPIVIAQDRELTLARGVTRDGSTTVRDGLLPAEGFDARDPGIAPPGDLMFRGVTRKGLDQLWLGLGVAPMNQRRDDTKPTWKIGVDVGLAVGETMELRPSAPGAEQGVGRGVHDLRIWTSVARRYAHTEGWFELFWQTPIAARAASLFQDPGYGATNVMPAQRGGVSAGIETYFLDDKLNQNRISLDVGARMVGVFEGRAYSELWEVFANAGTGPLLLDSNPREAGVQGTPFPGISNLENHLELGTTIALRAQLGPRVRFSVGATFQWKTDHAITFADAGIDLPACSTGRRPCEDGVNEVVNPGTEEVNPLHVPLIDGVGRRYLSTDNFAFVLGVNGTLLF